jgi:sugar/nucleoside kinase (ribokinase family)
VQVVGTTGAGDCAIGGFIAALLRGLGPEATIRTACAVGASNVESADATSAVQSWQATQERIAGGWVRSDKTLAQT